MFDQREKQKMLDEYFPFGRCAVKGCDVVVAQKVIENGVQVVKFTEKHRNFFMVGSLKNIYPAAVCPAHFDAREEIAPALFAKANDFNYQWGKRSLEEGNPNLQNTIFLEKGLENLRENKFVACYATKNQANEYIQSLKKKKK